MCKKILDPDECKCGCHEGSGLLHCLPCCRRCPFCGLRIILVSFGSHVRAHEEKGDVRLPKPEDKEPEKD